MFNKDTVKCPVCGSNIVNEDYAKDDCYVCWNRPDGEHGGTCRTIIGCYCSNCDELLPPDRFGFRNGAYECKKCGKVHWGYTEFKKDSDELDSMLNSYTSETISFMNMLRSR